MVLVLVLHELESVTATVPMCVLAINDLKKRKQIPDGFGLRQVVPTTGLTSSSMWDVTDLALFEEWLAENLGPGVTHHVLQVVEQFSYGLMNQVTQGRMSDKAKHQMSTFSSGTKQAVTRAGEQLTDFDKKYEISERTSQTFKKMSDAATQAKVRAMENPTIAKVSTNVNAGVQAGLKSVGVGFDWARSYLTTTLHPSSAQLNASEPVPPAQGNATPSTPLISPNDNDPTTSQERNEQGTPVFDLAGDEEDRTE